MNLSDIKRGWDNFFFSKETSEWAAVQRILIGSLLLLTFIMDMSHLEDYFGIDGLQSLQTVKSQFRYHFNNLFHLLPENNSSLYFITGLHILAALCFIFGFCSRVAAIVLFITLVSFNQRNINLLSSYDLLLRINIMLLIFAPIGDHFSIDSFLRKRRGKSEVEQKPVWILRLIQIQLSVVYVMTVYQKLKGDTWFDGTALYYSSRLHDFTRYPLSFITDSLIMLKLLTWGTLVLEFFLGTLIWVKEFRKPLVITGIVFHIGIEYLMLIPHFEIIMMILLIAMLTPNEQADLIHKIKNYCSRFLAKRSGRNS
jgi:uncharacterized membrane protein YphA (DoxX/SURF4 family)